MIRGFYRFYQDGQLLTQTDNLLTLNGKKIISRYLAKQVAGFGETLSIGIGTTPPTVDDLRLEFETIRVPVTVTSIDWINNTLVFKSILDSTYSGSIREVGLLSLTENLLSGNYGSKLLVSFEDGIEQWSTPIFASTNSRLGEMALRLSTLASGTINSQLGGASYDFSSYSLLDRFYLALHSSGTNTQSLTVRFKTTTADYFSYTTTGIVAGYQIINWSKGDMATSGTPEWANINSIEFEAVAKSTGAMTVDLDALRVEDGDNTDYPLVSRSVLSQPFTKASNKEMDIEYHVELFS